MTEDGISRRQVLRAASVAGGLGVASGAGASALLGDAESLDGGFGAGTLDLRVSEPVDLTGTDPDAWEPSFSDGIENGTSVGLYGGDDADAALYSMPHGAVGIALTVCDNPGRVTLTASRASDEAESEGVGRGGKPGRPEAEKPDGEKPRRPNGRKPTGNPSAVNGRGSPKNAALGKPGGHGNPYWWSPDDDPFVQIHAGTPRGPLIAEGALPSVLASLEDGVTLESGCRRLGKLEAKEDGSFAPAGEGETLGDDRFAFGDATVEITDRHEKGGGEVAGVDLAVDGAALCRVVVKGGGPPGDQIGSSGFDSPTPKTFGGGWHDGDDGEPTDDGDDGDDEDGHGYDGDGLETYTYDCATDATVYAGENPGNQQSAVSYVELFVCGSGPCVPCAPDDPFKLFLYWVGGLGEERLTLEFEAEQCRHAGDGGNQ